MSNLPKMKAKVTDCNGKPRGLMTIRADFHHGAPITVVHDGKTYQATGKQGTTFKTRTASVELATEADERIWANLDATRIWED